MMLVMNLMRYLYQFEPNHEILKPSDELKLATQVGKKSSKQY